MLVICDSEFGVYVRSAGCSPAMATAAAAASTTSTTPIPIPSHSERRGRGRPFMQIPPWLYSPSPAVEDHTSGNARSSSKASGNARSSSGRRPPPSDELGAVVVQELGEGSRRPAGDLLEGVGRVVVFAGEDRPLARDQQLGRSRRYAGADEA